MIFTPHGEVYLLNTPLENDYNNQLYFSSKTKQYNYFSSKIIKSFSDFTYIRQDGVIAVPACKEDLYNCNYVMYQNTNFGNKWFYAFITELEYKNPNCTYIHIETDAWQTWCFDVKIYDSFIVREHTNDDTIGSNIVPENLETGDTIVNFTSRLWPADAQQVIVMSTSVDPTKITEEGLGNAEGGLYGGIYSGTAYKFAQLSDQGVNTINGYIEVLANNGKADAVTSIFMCPSTCIPNYSTEIVAGDVQHSTKPFEYYFTFSKAYGDQYATLDGYIPKNNKLYCYPYFFLGLTNNNGEYIALRYEDFELDNCGFIIYSSVNGGGSVVAAPVRYKGGNVSSIKVTCDGFPICNWTYNTYENWLAQHKNSLVIGTIAQSVASIGSGAVSSYAGGKPTGIISGAISAAATIVSTIGEVKDAAVLPPSVSGSSSPNILSALGYDVPVYERRSIKKDIAKTIDDFFSMYGYKTNKVKQPNLTGRENWNYVETQNINISLDGPDDDLNTVKVMFNSGVTFWHNPDTFGDYSQTNNIV